MSSRIYQYKKDGEILTVEFIEYGETTLDPMFKAIEDDDIDEVERLINEGMNIKNSFVAGRCNILSYAVYYGNVNIIRLLLSHGANPNFPWGNLVLCEAIKNGDIEIVNLLLQYGANVNLRQDDQWSRMPIHIAAKFNHFELIKLLISHGANVNARDDKGITPLHLISRYGNIRIVRFLVEHGAEIDAEDDDYGITPLYKAIKHGNSEVIKFLINNGANVKFKCKNKAPLIMAVEKFYKLNEDIIEFLLSHGVDINAKDKNGRTALDIAQEQEYEDLVDLLTKYTSFTSNITDSLTEDYIYSFNST